MSSLPLLPLSGSPWAIGEAHGRAVAGLVASNLDLYFRRFEDEVDLGPAEVRRRAQRYWPAIMREGPDFAAIIEGIAKGARQPLFDVVALNVRFELLYGEFSRIGQEALGGLPAPAGECTALAVLPDASADGHVRLGQNWDWIPRVAGVIQHLTLDDGLQILCFTEAGIAGGKVGLNSAGVGLVINGLVSNQDDWSRLARPFHLRTWDVLSSQTLPQAAAAVIQGVRSCSANFLIGAAGAPGNGAALDIEAAPEKTRTLEPAGGCLVHTNHFRDPDRLGIWQPLVEEWRSTYHRCKRMEYLLAEAATHGPIGQDDVHACLRDHAEFPESVCRHPNPALPEADRYATVASFVMDLHAGRMDIAAGPPCTHAYATYQV